MATQETLGKDEQVTYHYLLHPRQVSVLSRSIPPFAPHPYPVSPHDSRPYRPIVSPTPNLPPRPPNPTPLPASRIEWDAWFLPAINAAPAAQGRSPESSGPGGVVPYAFLVEPLSVFLFYLRRGADEAVGKGEAQHEVG